MRCAKCKEPINDDLHILIWWEGIWVVCEECYRRARKKIDEE